MQKHNICLRAPCMQSGYTVFREMRLHCFSICFSIEFITKFINKAAAVFAKLTAFALIGTEFIIQCIGNITGAILKVFYKLSRIKPNAQNRYNPMHKALLYAASPSGSVKRKFRLKWLLCAWVLLYPALLANTQAAEPGACEWPICRGNPALTGAAAETIGDLPDEKWQLLWSFAAGDEIRSSPVIEDKRVFIGSSDGSLYALGLEDGKKLWQFTASDGIEAPPLAAFETVYVGALDGMFYALDAQTGKLRWKYKTGMQIIGSANAFTLNNGNSKRVVVGSYDNKLHCLDAVTGRGVWVYKAESYINGSPAVAGNSIVFGGCDSKIRVLDAKSGKETISIDAGSYIPGSAAVDGKYAFAGHYGNQVICADLAAGSIVWKYGDEEKGSAFFASPAVAKGQVVIGDRDGNLHCINKQTGAGLWTFSTGTGIDGSAVIAGDKVICGASDGNLYILSLNKGKVLWSYETGGSISGSPAVSCGMVIAGTDDNRVYAFGRKKT